MCCGVFLLTGNIDSQIEHEGHDGKVYDDDPNVKEADPVPKQPEFQRKLDGAGYQSDPFCPGTGVPKASGLSEAQPRIAGGTQDHVPHFDVA